MKRLLVVEAGKARPGPALEPAGMIVDRRRLPASEAPAAEWDALVAAVLAADVIVTERE